MYTQEEQTILAMCSSCSRTTTRMPATGRAFAIPGVTVVVRRNGKIVRESLYYDRAEMQCQLGQ